MPYLKNGLLPEYVKADSSDNERGARRAAREAAAKAVCRRCPVRPECAAHALATKEAHGVWGGMSEADRARQHG